MVKEKVRSSVRYQFQSGFDKLMSGLRSQKLRVLSKLSKSYFYAVKKEVLKNVNGEFPGCELSAIIGKSGSGKTSLLNILSGYTSNNVSGSIRINDIENGQEMRKQSKYVRQNYALHHFITVREAMNFSANFKLHGMSQACKNNKVSSF